MSRKGLAGTIAALIVITASVLTPSARAQSQLETVKARGTLQVGVRFDSPPFGFVDADGKNVGIDVEIAQELAKRLGTKLQLLQVTAQSRIPMLNSGKVDLLLAALTHTREREKAIDFSITYVNDAIKMLVKTDSGIKGPSDMTGKVLSLIQGSTVLPAVKRVMPGNVRIVQYQENPQAYLSLRQGMTDAFLTDVLTLDKLIQSDSAFQIVGPDLSTEPIAIGLRKNDSDWRNAINAMLQDMVTDGTWDRIVKKFVHVPLARPEMWP